MGGLKPKLPVCPYGLHKLGGSAPDILCGRGILQKSSQFPGHPPISTADTADKICKARSEVTSTDLILPNEVPSTYPMKLPQHI